MIKRACITVVTSDYISYALVLFNSMRAKSNCQADFIAFVIGETNPQLPVSEVKQEKVTDSILNADLSALAQRYSPTEICCYAKPHIINHCLQHGYKQVLFFDSDIMVLGNYDSLWEMLESHSVLLTPHIQKPLPEDGFEPNEHTLLKSGVYNAGFIGTRASDEGKAFINWWQQKVMHNCTIDYFHGMNADQKWLDLAPALFKDLIIIRKAGINTGYWSISSESEIHNSNTISINNEPIIFFHFSGFKKSNPTNLSKHQNRITVRKGSALEKLLHDYAKQLELFEPYNVPIQHKKTTQKYFRNIETFLYRAINFVFRQ